MFAPFWGSCQFDCYGPLSRLLERLQAWRCFMQFSRMAAAAAQGALLFERPSAFLFMALFECGVQKPRQALATAMAWCLLWACFLSRKVSGT